MPECPLGDKQGIPWSKRTQCCWDILLDCRCPQRLEGMTLKHMSQWQTLTVQPWHGYERHSILYGHMKLLNELNLRFVEFVSTRINLLGPGNHIIFCPNSRKKLKIHAMKEFGSYEVKVVIETKGDPNQYLMYLIRSLTSQCGAVTDFCVHIWIKTFYFPFSGDVCNRLAGARGGWESSAFTWKVLQQHPGPVPGTLWLTHPHKHTPDIYWDWRLITFPRRYGVNHPMAPVQSTFSQVWEGFCKLCCLATPVLG